jgi:hypothetical protein
MKITKQEIEACFPSDIIPKISLDYNIWEVKFYMEYYNFVLFIDCTSSTSNDNDVWYTARLYIRNNHNFEINYGFSNYVNS